LAPALVIVAALGLAGCSQEKAEVKDIIRPVKVVEIGQVQNTRELEYSGSVRAPTEMNLAFASTAKITERLVDIGQHVASGRRSRPHRSHRLRALGQDAQASLDAAERQVETVDLARKRAEQAVCQELCAEVAARTGDPRLLRGTRGSGRRPTPGQNRPTD